MSLYLVTDVKNILDIDDIFLDDSALIFNNFDRAVYEAEVLTDKLKRGWIIHKLDVIKNSEGLWSAVYSTVVYNTDYM